MRRALLILLVVLECVFHIGTALAGLTNPGHNRRNRRHH